MGNNDIVGENEEIVLYATIDVPGYMPPVGGNLLPMDTETLTLSWYKRSIDEADYPEVPFATTTLELGTLSVEQTDNPIEESTYYKVVMTDAIGVNCEAEVLKIKANLKKVLFLNSLPLYKDPPAIGLFVPTNPILPNNWHWNADNIDNTKPVWYRIGNTLEIRALLQLKGINAEALNNLRIKTTANIGFELTTSEASLESVGDPDNYLYQSSSILATQAFLDIAAFEQFLLDWKYSPDNGSVWKNLRNSTNPCYISRPPLEGYVYFHTTLHLSCTAAQGLADEQQIVNNIYKVFTTKDVKKYGFTNAMDYWGPQALEVIIITTSDLLSYHSGRCGAWARFFVDMLAIQGINSELKSLTRMPSVLVPPYWLPVLAGQSLTNLQTDLANTANAGDITFNSSTATALGCFLVKHWDVQSSHFYIRMSQDIDPNENYQEYVTPVNNVAQEGVPAQGNNNPRSRFYDHTIVKYNNAYYDSSYGSYSEAASTTMYNTDFPPFSSLIEWEQYSLDAMGATFGFNTDEILWIENNNPETLDLIENNQNY